MSIAHPVRERASRPAGAPRAPRTFVVAAFASTTALALLGLAGTRSRYVADDYYFARGVRERGFWGVQLHFYKTWSGRVTSSFLQAVLKFLGPWTAAVLPAAILGIWLLGSWVAVRTLDRARDRTPDRTPRLPRTTALALASSYVAINVFCTPNLFQTLFWESGSPNYAVPQMLISWLVAVMASRRFPIGRHGAAAVVAFAIASTSEPAVVMCVSVLSTFALFHPGRRSIYVAPIIGAVIAALVVALAPGNDVRQSAILAARTPEDTVVLGLVQWFVAVWGMIVSHPWSFVGAVAFGLTCAQLVKQAREPSSEHPGEPVSERADVDRSAFVPRRTSLFVVTAMLTVALPISAFTLFAFLTGSPIPARAVPVVLNPMLLGVGLLAFGVSLRRTIAPANGSTRGAPAAKAIRTAATTVGLIVATVLASLVRLPAEFAGGASLVQATESIHRQFRARDTTRIEMPMLVGGVFFASPEDLQDPNGYWGERFASTGIRYVVTNRELWSSSPCKIC